MNDFETVRWRLGCDEGPSLAHNHTDAYAALDRIEAEVESLRGSLDEWKADHAALNAEVEGLRAALEQLAHPTMDAHELAHLDDFHQGDIETARAALDKEEA